MPKLLIIDDERLTVDLLETYFKMKGFEVVRAERGTQGVAVASQELPDVIIVDMMMPDISGDRVVRMIRENPENQHKPIVVLSALHSLDAQRRARESGANQFLPKNTPLPELYQHITHLLH